MSARLIAGMVLVILGIGALLGQFTSFDFGSFISDWWPMLLVLVGVIQLTTRSAPLAGALVLIVAGLVLEAGALELLPIGFWELFWPVILIAIGGDGAIRLQPIVRTPQPHLSPTRIEGLSRSRPSWRSGALRSRTDEAPLPDGYASRPQSATCGMPGRGRRETMYQRGHVGRP